MKSGIPYIAPLWVWCKMYQNLGIEIAQAALFGGWQGESDGDFGLVVEGWESLHCTPMPQP